MLCFYTKGEYHWIVFIKIHKFANTRKVKIKFMYKMLYEETLIEIYIIIIKKWNTIENYVIIYYNDIKIEKFIIIN